MTDEQLRAAIMDIVTDAWDRSRQIDGAVDEIMDAVALAAQHPSREERMVVLDRNAEGKPTIWCDPEIADIVAALNTHGLKTDASCCGHGYLAGLVSLADGRQVLIAKDAAERDLMLSVFPTDINGTPRQHPSQSAGEPVAWISVDDQMPPADEPVLCYNGRWTGVGAWMSDEHLEGIERWQDEQREFIEMNGPRVSHWRPLPAPPAMQTVCCGRAECGGECGNEWQGMEPAVTSPPPTDAARVEADRRDAALRLARAHIKWLAFGECRADGWEGPPPTALQAVEAIDAALAAEKNNGIRPAGGEHE